MIFNKIAKFLKEDFPKDFYEVADKLFPNLNQMSDQLNKLTNKQITVKDNLKAQIYTVSLTGAELTAGSKIKWEQNEQPTLVLVGTLVDKTQQVIVLPSFLLWEYSSKDSTIRITLTGLVAADKYTITLVGIV